MLPKELTGDLVKRLNTIKGQIEAIVRMLDDETDLDKMNDILSEIKDFEPKGNKMLELIPSKNGYHIITNPFNLEFFNNVCDDKIEVHKDNPTNLYIP